ncbi:MAG: hypothetical protein ACOCRK_03285 [bacterium]
MLFEDRTYKMLLQVVTTEGPIKGYELEDLFVWLNENERSLFNKILKNMIEENELLYDDKGFKTYFIAPAKLKQIEDKKYRLLGHPGAEDHLNHIGKIIYSGTKRLFTLDSSIKLLRRMLRNQGIILEEER